MSNRERRVLDNVNASTSYWQERHNPAEYERKQPHNQTDYNTYDNWIIVLCILFTIGFISLLAKTTLWSIF